MDDTMKTTAQWLKDELEFINGSNAGGLNAMMHPALESFDDDAKEIVLRYPIEEWEINGLNTLHGGISTTMMDLTMSITINCYSRVSIPPTISMAVNFVRPISASSDVLVRARVTSVGRKNATAYCEVISCETGKVGCTCIGTYAIIHKD